MYARTSILLILASQAAYADGRIVLLADPPRVAELHAALQVSLAGVMIVDDPAPKGELRLDRAAIAQRAAVTIGADAGVWIDDGEVCAVSADGRAFRHAPLTDPRGRVFAAVATSLLDEMLEPPEAALPPIHVDVHVDVTPPAHTPPPMVLAPPGIAVDEEAPVAPRPQTTRIELGPMLSPVSAGLEAEVSFPLAHQMAIGAIGLANVTFDRSSALLGGAVELKHVGRGHFEYGGIAGGAVAENDPAALVGTRLSFVWEHVALSLTPVVLFGWKAEGVDVIPGAWMSLRWVLRV